MTATVAARGDPEAPVIHRRASPGPWSATPSGAAPARTPASRTPRGRPSPTTPRADPGAVAPAQLAIGCGACRRRHRCCSAASSTTRRCSRPATPPWPTPSAGHAVHLGAWYADCVGPLLVPAPAVADLVRVLDVRDAVAAPGARRPPRPRARRPSRGRPGHDDRCPRRPAATRSGCGSSGPSSRGRKGGATSGSTTSPLALEVPRGADHAVAVADVHSALAQGRRVVAKFRTGPTAHLGLARRGRARRRSSGSAPRWRCRSS